MSNISNSEFLNLIRSQFKTSTIHHYSQPLNGDVLICIKSPAKFPQSLLCITVGIMKHYRSLSSIPYAITYTFSKELFHSLNTTKLD